MLYSVGPDIGPQRPVTSSKVPVTTGRVRSCPIGLTQRPVILPLLYAPPHQYDRTLNSVQLESDRLRLVIGREYHFLL